MAIYIYIRNLLIYFNADCQMNLCCKRKNISNSTGILLYNFIKYGRNVDRQHISRLQVPWFLVLKRTGPLLSLNALKAQSLSTSLG